MKPRHVAALALVGWYLMVPPVESGGRVNFEAPLSQWHRWGSYDTARECSVDESDLIDRGKRVREEHPQNEMTDMFTQAQCIASDDPRLKPN